jgi:hypothetical protein
MGYREATTHIQLIRPPQFQNTLEDSRLHFGSYRPAPEDLVPVPDLVLDI